MRRRHRRRGRAVATGAAAGLHSPTLAPASHASEDHHRRRHPSRRPRQAAWTSWTHRTVAPALPATALPTLTAVAAVAAAVHGEGAAPVAPVALADRAAPAVPDAAAAAAALASLRARKGSRWRLEPRSTPPWERAPTWPLRRHLVARGGPSSEPGPPAINTPFHGSRTCVATEANSTVRVFSPRPLAVGDAIARARTELQATRGRLGWEQNDRIVLLVGQVAVLMPR